MGVHVCTGEEGSWAAVVVREYSRERFGGAACAQRTLPGRSLYHKVYTGEYGSHACDNPANL